MIAEVSEEELAIRIKRRRSGSTPIITLPAVLWPVSSDNVRLICLCSVLLHEQIRALRQKMGYQKTPRAKAQRDEYNHRPHVKKKRDASAHRRWVEDPAFRARQTAISAKRFKENQEHHQRKNREWIAKNRFKYTTWMTDHMREKRRNDPNYRVGNRLRSRLWHAVSNQKAKKAAKTTELVGCSLLDLRKHLESLFLPGMTWENTGLWHIDHIHPCIKFDLTNPDEQRKCFHFSNLQPLWAGANLRKGAKIPCQPLGG